MWEAVLSTAGCLAVSVTGAYALDAASNTPKFCQPKISPGIAICPRGATTSPADNWGVNRMPVSGTRAEAVWLVRHSSDLP